MVKVRLTDVEANYLGFKLRKKQKMGNARYPLNDEQVEQLKLFRTKHERKFVTVAKKLDKDGNLLSRVEKLQATPVEIFKGHEIIGTTTNATLGQQWIRTKPIKEDPKIKEKFWDDLIESVKENAPKFTPIKYIKKANEGLIVISPSDVHIGKLASKFETLDEYNSSIACERVQEGVFTLKNRIKRLDIEKVLLLIGNDILHIDSPKRTTTSGTPQDTDGMWYDNFVLAESLYAWIINELSEIAPLHVQFNPSNHDFMSGFYLSRVTKAHFHNSTNVTFDIDMTHRKYFKYGVNLIGSTHGDGAKVDDLALLMANEAPEWSETARRYFYIHHFHHKIAKDKSSVEIESMRSTSGADGWHHRNGYQHAPKTMQAFFHDKKLGRTDVMTHYF